MNKSFAEIFCLQFGLSPARYAAALRRRVYYPHAAPLLWVLRLALPKGMARDRELIQEVGLMTRIEQLPGMLSDYRYDECNRSFWRSRLRLRVSTHRLERIIRRVMAGEPKAEEHAAGSSAAPAGRE